MSYIEIRDVCRHYEQKGKRFTALSHVDLAIERGEFICLLGPSGCGKSTLLAALAGFDRVSSGSVRIAGEEVTSPSIKNVTIFQNYGLLPWRTVEKNVELGLESLGTAPEERTKIARHYLALVGLERFASHHPAELSGGMQQRVAIARALAVDPDIIFMDEPFAALDAITRMSLQDEISAICRKQGKTIIFVTHDIDEAVVLADRVVVMTPNPGKVKSIIEVDLHGKRDRTSPDFLHIRDRIFREFSLKPADKTEYYIKTGRGVLGAQRTPLPFPISLFAFRSLFPVEVIEPFLDQGLHEPRRIVDKLPFKAETVENLRSLRMERDVLLISRQSIRQGRRKRNDRLALEIVRFEERIDRHRHIAAPVRVAEEDDVVVGEIHLLRKLRPRILLLLAACDLKHLLELLRIRLLRLNLKKIAACFVGDDLRQCRRIALLGAADGIILTRAGEIRDKHLRTAKAETGKGTLQTVRRSSQDRQQDSADQHCFSQIHDGLLSLSSSIITYIMEQEKGRPAHAAPF